MKHRSTRALLALTVVLFVASCVSISGQRISWFHDEAKDTLKILIHYDGIHEGTGTDEKGEDQLPEFINNGDIMILDWWGHLEMRPIRKKLKDGNVIEKMIAKVLTSFQTQAIGHYTDPDGRVGALQMVTIPKVSRFVKTLNQLISAAVLAGKLGSKTLPRTLEVQKAAARDRHEWIVLDGHSLRIQLPTHPDEIGRMKANYLGRLLHKVQYQDTPEHKNLVQRITRQIADAPVSVIQEEEQLTLVFGYRKRTCTIRITGHDRYNGKLEEAVKKHVSTDLDLGFATALLNQGGLVQANAKVDEQEPPNMPGIYGDLITFGPAEDQINALYRLANDARNGRSLPGMEAAATHEKTLAAMEQFGKTWNARGLTPQAPLRTDAESYLDAWKVWHNEVAGRKPLGQEP